MNSITQDMKYRQSLLTYAQKYGVSRASRKYNKSRSYIYFWRARYDGSLQSLACQSRRPHSHPNQHTPEELKLISDMHRRNPKLGIVELWARMRKRGYTRTVESLWRVMRREGWTAQGEKKKPYKPKPYEQMQYPGQRVQIDVKVVPRRCITDPQLKLYQYTAIDEYSRYRVLGAYEEQSAFSSADFLSKVVTHFARKGVAVECVRPITVLSSPIAFPIASATWKPSLRQRPDNWEFATSSSAPIRPATMERWNAAIEKTKNVSTIRTVSIPSPTLVGRKLPTKA